MKRPVGEGMPNSESREERSRRLQESETKKFADAAEVYMRDHRMSPAQAIRHVFSDSGHDKWPQKTRDVLRERVLAELERRKASQAAK